MAKKMYAFCKLVLWRPTHGRARQDQPRKSYMDLLVEDTNLAFEDLPNTMRDRKIWRTWCSYANLGRINEGTLPMMMMMKCTLSPSMNQNLIVCPSGSYFDIPIINYYNYRSQFLFRTEIERHAFRTATMG